MAIKSFRKLSKAFERALGEVQDEGTNKKDSVERFRMRIPKTKKSVCKAIKSLRTLSKAFERTLGETQDENTNRKDSVCMAIESLRKLSKTLERVLGEVWDDGTNRTDFVCNESLRQGPGRGLGCGYKQKRFRLQGDQKPSKRTKRRFSWTRVIIVESKQPKVVFLTKRNAIGKQIAIFGKTDRPKSRYQRGFHRTCMSR
jgi:hypothetical protein